MIDEGVYVDEETPEKGGIGIALEKGGIGIAFLTKTTINTMIPTRARSQTVTRYWLYAAIKFKCLIVTNDEMRDHLFQLLGNDFFPKWIERHQVHFSFSDTGPVFHMPPSCSVVIQESEKGHWHIPIVSEHDSEGERTWLCIMRASSHVAMQASTTIHEGSQFPHHEKGYASSDAETRTQAILPPQNLGNHKNTKHPPQETYRNLRNIGPVW